MDLKSLFWELLQRHNVEEETIEKYFNELIGHYSNKKRVYHNLQHLTNLFTELKSIKSDIEDWDTICFSLFYHDIIYNVRKQDNEAVSADLAFERLLAIEYPRDKAEQCRAQINATKGHTVATAMDTNYFTDADLAILGKDWNEYLDYSKRIRKEYKIYPALLYNPARKKVLQHFLAMPAIYKTQHFKELYEAQARENIANELKQFS